MTIIEQSYDWRYDPGRRSATDYIVLHHAAGSGDAQAVHRYHRDVMGWAGIAYHYYIRRDGTIYRGRPEDWKGGHTEGYNGVSIGICFEGNFDVEIMEAAQLAAGKWLVAQMRDKYPAAVVATHGDLTSTACPGAHFPLAEMLDDEDDGAEDAPRTWEQTAAKKALELGIVQGDGTGHYGWQQSVTLARLLVILDRLGMLDE